MSISNSLLGKPPDNYKEVLYWKINQKAGRIAMVNLLSIPLAVVFGIVFILFVRMFGNSTGLTWSTNEFLIFFIGIVILLVLHELIHGILMQSFRAKAKYGFWGQGLMFYATAPGYAFKRYQYLIIALGPLVILSILACLGIVIQSGTSFVWLFALWAIVNGSASNGDLWITAVVLRYPASAVVVDEMDGLRIFIPLEDSKFAGL